MHFSLLKDLSLLQTEGGAVKKSLNTFDRGGYKLWSFLDFNVNSAAEKIVLFESGLFSICFEKLGLKISNSLIKDFVSWTSFG